MRQQSSRPCKQTSPDEAERRWRIQKVLVARSRPRQIFSRRTMIVYAIYVGMCSPLRLGYFIYEIYYLCQLKMILLCFLNIHDNLSKRRFHATLNL